MSDNTATGQLNWISVNSGPANLNPSANSAPINKKFKWTQNLYLRMDFDNLVIIAYTFFIVDTLV